MTLGSSESTVQIRHLEQEGTERRKNSLTRVAGSLLNYTSVVNI